MSMWRQGANGEIWEVLWSQRDMGTVNSLGAPYAKQLGIEALGYPPLITANNFTQ